MKQHRPAKSQTVLLQSISSQQPVSKAKPPAGTFRKIEEIQGEKAVVQGSNEPGLH